MMNRMNVATSHRRRLCRLAGSLSALVLVAMPVLLCGCQELVYMGQLSDRESSWSINRADIEQQQSDGEWKVIGTTDGNGRWWIMKEDIQGGGRVRIIKPGYYPLIMSESEFLNEPNLLMIPSSSKGGFGGSSDGMWQRDDRLFDHTRHH